VALRRHPPRSDTPTQHQRRQSPLATFAPESARKRHVSAGFIAAASGSQRNAHRARENRLARYGPPESPPTPRFDPAEFDRDDYPAPRVRRASPTRKKAPAHKAAGANGTTTT
jgi:hypothetical protein